MEVRRPLVRSTLIPFKRMHPNAKMPEQRPGDVGFDVFCTERAVLPAGSTTQVPVGWALADSVPEMYATFGDGRERLLAVPFLKIEGRSSVSKQGIFPVGGIIDPSYRGEIGALLHNGTDQDLAFPAGTKIAQLVCYYTLANVEGAHVVRFVEQQDVVPTERGDAGFGSTGER